MDFKRSEIKESHPVLEILRSGPGRGKSLGLVLEGGGMRGSVVAGAALALEQLGLQNVFSSFYGSSAGAITASYLAASQATWGTSVFYEDLLDERFFSWKRLRKRQPPLNLDFLFNEVVTKRKPLDWEKANGKVRVFASHAATGELHSWNQWQDQKDFLGALRSSATLPLMAGGPYLYHGQEYFDAGVHSPVPWKEALQEETHLLVLLSRPENKPRPPLRKLDTLLARNLFAKRYPQLLPLHLRTVDRYNKSLEKLRLLQDEGRVLVVSPLSSDILPGIMERNRQVIIGGILGGARALYRELFGTVPELNEMIVSSKEGKPLWQQKQMPGPLWWL